MKKITMCDEIFAQYCITMIQVLCLSVDVDFMVLHGTLNM